MAKKTTVEDIILSRLDKLESAIESKVSKVEEKIDTLHTKYDKDAVDYAKEISSLKVKSSLMGGISGAVSGIAIVLIEMFKPR